MTGRTTTEDILARSRKTLDRAYDKIVKDIPTQLLADELTARGYVVTHKAKAPQPEPQPGPPGAGYQPALVALPSGDILMAWTPELDGRPPGNPRFGIQELHPGPAKRGECTNCVRDRQPVGAAAWRLTTGGGTTIRTYCLECAETYVKKCNLIWDDEQPTVLPPLVPKRVLTPPTFATAEEALAWLDEHE